MHNSLRCGESLSPLPNSFISLYFYRQPLNSCSQHTLHTGKERRETKHGSGHFKQVWCCGPSLLQLIKLSWIKTPYFKFLSSLCNRDRHSYWFIWIEQSQVFRLFGSKIDYGRYQCSGPGHDSWERPVSNLRPLDSKKRPCNQSLCQLYISRHKQMLSWMSIWTWLINKTKHHTDQVNKLLLMRS